MAPVYDLMMLLDVDAPEERRTKIVADAEAAITSQGTLVSKHDWGTRALAYEIDHRKEADYHLLQFTGPAALLESLQRSLKLADGVVRFRIIRLAPGTPDPPHVRPEPRPPEAEAEPAEAPEAPPAPESEPAEPAPAEPAPAEPAPAEPAPAEPAPAEPAPTEPAPAE